LIRESHFDTGTGPLYRTSRDGRRGTAHGVLEDYAGFAQACLTLLAATGEIVWYQTAEALLDRILEHFVADGSYFDTAADAEELIWRPQDPTDNATPAGVSLAAEAFTTLASLTGSVRYETAAEQALSASAAIAARAPRFAGRALAVAETIAAGPLEIAIAGRSPALLQVAFTHAPWGTAIVQGAPELDVPLMAGRTLVADQPVAYLCQKFTCRLPVAAPEALREQLI